MGTENIIGGTKKYGVRRLVSLTGGWRQGPQRPADARLSASVILLKLLQRDVLKDAVNHAEAMNASGLDWVIVRGPRLTDGPETGAYKADCVGEESYIKVPLADIADFMLEQSADDTYLHGAPMLSS